MRTSVRHAAVPVVNDIIKNIQTPCVIAIAIQTAAHAPIPARIMRQQIVMKAADVAADGCRITMPRSRWIIFVVGDMQRFGNQSPLQCQIFSAATAERFVYRPADTRMVQNGILPARQTHSVKSSAVSQAHTHKPGN